MRRVFRKGKKEDPGNCMPVSLISIHMDERRRIGRVGMDSVQVNPS